MDAALDEVERRMRGGLRGVASAETRVTSQRARERLVQRANNNQPLLGVGIVTVGGAAAYGACSLLAALRERQKPQHRLERGLNELRESFGTRVRNTQEQAERARGRGLLLKLETQDGGYVRVSDARLGGVPRNRREHTTMLKKLFWTGLVSVLVAVGTVVARRLADRVWRATIHEAPPDSSSKAAA
jgi:hypothetical protein